MKSRTEPAATKSREGAYVPQMKKNTFKTDKQIWKILKEKRQDFLQSFRHLQ